jgi:uncharacterized protein
MRLTSFEVENIVNLARNKFGEDVKVILFGSRTDDSKRGGDIDLLIVPSGEKDIAKLTLLEIQLLAGLKLAIGDQKIDILIKTIDDTNKLVYQQAMDQGIPLC